MTRYGSKKLSVGTVFLAFLLIGTVAQAQENTVSGKVTDAATKKSLPGVNILVKGTVNGTSTDKDGAFKLTVSSRQDTLIFSFVGYQSRQIPIQGRENLGKIQLKKKASQLEEMIVTGYQAKEKSTVTGSVSEISGEKIAQEPTVNVVKSLEGKLPGLKINNRGGLPGTPNSNILIRGKETFGDNTPLYIIDGVPSKEEDFTSLTPQNIASVNVLKDASAAIYGARAANGVIVVKTKRGKAGESSFTVEAHTGFTGATVLPELMNSSQYATYKDEVEERYGRTITYTDKDIQLYKNGTKPLTHPNTDWLGAVLRKYAPQNNINIAGQGGNDNIQYYISGGYTNKGTLFHGEDMYYKKYQIRSNIDTHPMKYLKVGIDVNARLRRIHHPVVSPAGLFTLARLTIPMAVDKYPNGLPGTGGVAVNPVIASTNKGGWQNSRKKLFKTKITGDLDLGWVTQGLSLRGIATFNYNIGDNGYFYNTFNEYTYNPNTGGYDATLGSVSERQNFTRLRRENELYRQKYYNALLRYKNSFGNHNINAFIAYELESGYNNNLSGYRRDLTSPRKVYLDLASTHDQTTSGIATNTGRVSEFGSISYNYKLKYLLDFTLRRDGSFNFPQNGRWGVFPSVSAGWNITNEPFMSGTKAWLSNLKIRSSYGQLGNDQVPSFQYLTKYNLSQSMGYWIFGDTPKRANGFEQTNIPNPNITWEVAKNWDIGLDASLFNDKITMSFDYFSDKRREMLIQREGKVPSYTGLSLPQQNIGKINNHGIEFKIGYQNNSNGDWQYNFTANLSYNENKIIYMAEPKDLPSYQKQTGHPVDSYLLYRADGIFRNQQEVNNTKAKLDGTKPGDIKYVDINNDGKIDHLDKERVDSSPIPKVQYGFTGGFSYKNFRFSAFIQGQALAKNYISPNRGADSNEPLFYFKKRWTPNNKDASYPRAMERTDFYNYAHRSTFWLYNAGFVRLKNVTVNYKLPVGLMNSISHINNISVYLSGSNLWAWSPMNKRMGGKYYDVENNTPEGSYYPQQRVFEAGVKIKFK